MLPMNTLEDIWDRILSRQPGQILTAFRELDQASQQTVLDHLRRMASEDGWHPEQVKSAAAALSVLQSVNKLGRTNAA